MSYDLERAKHEQTEIRKAFREIFPLADEADLPWAPCGIKGFLRERLRRECEERTFHFTSRVARILCEVSPPKTHVEDMARIVVETASWTRATLQMICTKVGIDPLLMNESDFDNKIARRLNELLAAEKQAADRNAAAGEAGHE